MIDYRPSLVKYFKSVLGDTYPVFDGAMSFRQPENNYLTYYIVNEETKSIKNSSSPVFNAVSQAYEVTHSPMKRVSLLIDVRGDHSFFDSRRLYDSFYEPSANGFLLSLGIGFLAVDGISSLPHLKEGYNEEGYSFTLHFTYNASYITDIEIIEKITMATTGRNCSSSGPVPVPVDCTNSVGGIDGTQYNLTGVWLPTCTMFKS